MTRKQGIERPLFADYFQRKQILNFSETLKKH